MGLHPTSTYLDRSHIPKASNCFMFRFEDEELGTHSRSVSRPLE